MASLAFAFRALLLLYTATSLDASALIAPRDGPPSPGSPTIPDPGLVPIPDTAKAPNTFHNGLPERGMDQIETSDPVPDYYQPRDIDLPFGRMVHGKMSLFPYGQVNSPSWNTNDYKPGKWDNPNQSACGIPDCAFGQQKAAIHPYWLKYAGLDRYCMQDVCISLWPEGKGGDHIVKVTDVCSTDPDDPTHCADPTQIKVDRAKVQVLYQIPGAGIDDEDLQKPVYPKGVYWHFTKCWLMGLPQPAYADNWFGQPILPNNLHWDIDATQSQMKNNQKTYPDKGWPTYPDGSQIPDDAAKAAIVPIKDWTPGQEPAWAPIAGGKGYGTPERSSGPPPGLYPGKSTALAHGGSGAVEDTVPATNLTTITAGVNGVSDVQTGPAVTTGKQATTKKCKRRAKRDLQSSS